VPRKRKGEQAIRTQTNQQYGQAKMQEEAQAAVPLPTMDEPQIPTMRAGEQPFGRRSERPNEMVTTTGQPEVALTPEVTQQRKMQMLAILPLLEQAASEPYASPQTRNFARRLRLAIGPMEDLQNQNRA
tara:strand:+ start:116 stop:502 length:387 start_codon:yes stop_codon:yes gene_type:complete